VQLFCTCTMRTKTAAALLLGTIATHAHADVPDITDKDPRFEPHASLPAAVDRKNMLSVLRDAVYTIRRRDQICDTVSAVTPLIEYRGFHLTCNHGAFAYDFRNYNDHWEVWVNDRLLSPFIIPAPPKTSK
jgi:hypothetical protein